MASKRHSARRTALAIILTGLLAFGFPAPALAEIAFTATDLDLMEGEGQAEDTPAAEDPASTEPAQPEIHQVEVEDGTWFYIEARTGSNGLIIRSTDGKIDTSATSGVIQRYLVGFKLKEVTPDSGGDDPEPTPTPGGDDPESTPTPAENDSFIVKQVLQKRPSKPTRCNLRQTMRAAIRRLTPTQSPIPNLIQNQLCPPCPKRFPTRSEPSSSMEWRLRRIAAYAHGMRFRPRHLPRALRPSTLARLQVAAT